MAKQTGQLYGTGAAVYLNLGGVPDVITVYNATDGDEFDKAFPRKRFIPFTSGGVQEPKPGDELTGDTTKSRVVILEVLKVSGTWAGGDAAGFFVVDVRQHKKGNVPSNFGSENVSLVARHSVQNGNASLANVATVTAGVAKGFNSAAAVVGIDNSNDIDPWLGDDTNNFEGVKLGTDISESGKLLIWEAEFTSLGQ